MSSIVLVYSIVSGHKTLLLHVATGFSYELHLAMVRRISSQKQYESAPSAIQAA
jgi:hypothetical protein